MSLETQASQPSKSPLPPEIVHVPIDHLITEDDTPVDGIYQEAQMRLLTEPLYSSWTPGRKFWVSANVGVFFVNRNPAIVPDVFLSMDVSKPDDKWEKRGRSYFVWEAGKSPEIVIEVVSNNEGNELTRKKEIYAEIGVIYYVVWDPQNFLGDETLHCFELHKRKYQPIRDLWFPEVGLGLTLWRGTYESTEDEWLRWCDQDRRLIPTGHEGREAESKRAAEETRRADQEARRAQEEARRADEEKKQKEAALKLAEKQAAKLRELGIDPNSL